MNKRLDILREKEPPNLLDEKVLAAARFAAARNSKQKNRKKFILISSAIAASFVAGFAVIMVPRPQPNKFEVQYYALNDLSNIEQEAFALASELNCNTVYALDNSGNWENL